MPANWIILCEVALAVFLIVQVLKVLYVAFTSPLNIIPGPFYARFTELPSRLATLQRRQAQYHHELHQRYGHFVRVAPNQVFVSDVAAYKAIHRIGGRFNKTDFYHFFNPTEAGAPPYGMFQMTDPSDHAKRRRLLGAGFTTSSLRATWEDMVREKATATIQGMQQDATISSSEVDVLKWWRFMASDVISKFAFGQSFDQLKTGKTDSFFDDLKMLNTVNFFAFSFPRVYSLAKRLPIMGRSKYFQAYRLMFERGQAALATGYKSAEKHNLFTKVLEQADTKDGTLTSEEMSVEAAELIVAGSDTTSNTLTYLVWAVLSNPNLHQALVDEVNALEEPFTDAQLQDLPILSAAIRETLRLYGPLPTPLPRVVPPGGATLGGYNMPAGSVVATQSYTLHRDPTIFHDPERFDHTRWLPAGSATLSEEANTAFGAFGAGSRMCIGIHLAYMEVRYGATLFFRRFKDARLAPTTTPDSMEIKILVLIEPKAKRCVVVV